MDDERDADYAIRGLDRREFGRKGRRLRVEWSKVSSVSTLYQSSLCNWLIWFVSNVHSLKVVWFVLSVYC